MWGLQLSGLSPSEGQESLLQHSSCINLMPGQERAKGLGFQGTLMVVFLLQTTLEKFLLDPFVGAELLGAGQWFSW